MRLNTVHGYLVACVVLGGGLLAWRGWDLDAPPPQGAPLEKEEMSASTPVAQPVVASNPNETSLNAPSPVSQALRSAPLQARPVVLEDIPPGWDELGSAERVAHLEGRFSAAMVAIEAGKQPVAKHVFVAESALTSMRAELYGTASGRARHRLQEVRLDRALGEGADRQTRER